MIYVSKRRQDYLLFMRLHRYLTFETIRNTKLVILNFSVETFS